MFLAFAESQGGSKEWHCQVVGSVPAGLKVYYPETKQVSILEPERPGNWVPLLGLADDPKGLHANGDSDIDDDDY